MNDFGFAPASKDESIVFGAQRPGYPSKSVNINAVEEWLAFMEKQGIKRICCLLPQNQLDYYCKPLLDIYRLHFAHDNICWSPIEDFQLSNAKTLMETILPFLKEAALKKEPAVVHCSGGIGRTGHILAAWLVHGRGFSPEKALASVKEMGRNSFEAVDAGNATKTDLFKLLLINR